MAERDQIPIGVTVGDPQVAGAIPVAPRRSNSQPHALITYIYCLSARDALAYVTLPPGVDGAEVEATSCRDIVIVTSRLPAIPTPIRRQHLDAHNAVTQAVLKGGVCIPMRYGTIVPAGQSGIDFILGNYEQWQAAVERLRGRVELSVKGVLPRLASNEDADEVVLAGGPGVRYLQQRRARYQAEQAIGEAAGAAVAELRSVLESCAERVELVARGRLITAAALLRHDRFATAREAVVALVERLPGRWVAGDVWPPYSFVDG
jgi:hypothetical protein